MDKNKLWIIIPAFNEGKRIEKVLSKIKAVGYDNIIVVDDGSKDNTFVYAKKYTTHALRHVVNRGAGAATKTGLEYAKMQNADFVITLDADGQHAVEDIPKVLKPILEQGLDVVIGSRLIKSEGMPLIRKIGNTGLNIITYLMFNLKVSDSQSGFKAFSKNALDKIQIRTDRYEFCSEIIDELRRNKLKFTEVPIQVIYTDESLGKGQSILGGIKTAWGIIKRKLFT